VIYASFTIILVDGSAYSGCHNLLGRNQYVHEFSYFVSMTECICSVLPPHSTIMDVDVDTGVGRVWDIHIGKS